MRLMLSLVCVSALCATPVFAQQAPAPAAPLPPEAPAAVQARPSRPAPPAPRPAPPKPGTPAPVVEGIQMPPMPPPPVPIQPPQSVIIQQPREPIPTQNIRIEVTISDSASTTPKKSVTMLVADGRNGRIRSESRGQLNVDARADAVPDGRIMLNLTLVYFPGALSDQPPTQINESILVLVPNGKPTLISQSADPTIDRKVTVEVTATVVK